MEEDAGGTNSLWQQQLQLQRQLQLRPPLRLSGENGPEDIKYFKISQLNPILLKLISGPPTLNLS